MKNRKFNQKLNQPFNKKFAAVLCAAVEILTVVSYDLSKSGK